MGNVMSKVCRALSYPIREYERRKVKKIYDEIFQDDVWDSRIYSDTGEI